MDSEKSENTQDIVAPGALDRKPERPWKLNVQGVVIESGEPTIKARDAIAEAGFDVSTPWIIVLKVQGEPKREIELDTLVDLRKPGLEKIRLTPRKIDNGEAHRPRRSDFQLLPKDEAYLVAIGAVWETAIDNGRRWLILRNRPLPTGYTVSMTDIALDVPAPYPGAQIDMFYVHPHLQRVSGQPIPQTDTIESVFGVGFQRWSRHRPDGSWNAAVDCIATHMALVEEALLREVE
ncbi:MAG: E2/UBC family protein [Gammaproteobacteria bacterium]